MVAPLSHGAGIHQLVQAARGVPTILLPTERFDIDEAYRLIETHRVTNIFTVPTILKMMVEHPAVDRYDHSSLRYVIYAGAPMYREDQKAALKKLGQGASCSISGSARSPATSRCCRRRCTIPRTGRRRGSAPAATSARGCRSRSRTMTGASCKPFETGEICVIGPAVFAGYYDNPEANAKAFRDGWFRTGDLGHMDEEGFVYITGRASDMYISGGSNIYPREVEEKILTHPAIGEVAVVGVPDPVWGEVGIAVCVPREGASAVSEAELATSWRQGAALQDAEALLLLGCAAEIRLRQDPETAGARRTGGARPAGDQRPRAAERCDASSSPGPPAPERIQWVEARGRAFSFDAASRPAAAGSRAPRLCGAGLCRRRGERRRAGARPLRLCDAGAVEDREHAAFYSDTFRPAGVTRLKMGAMTLGLRDGAPFFHCHALWTEADGRADGGHILPEETFVAEPFAVDAFGIDGAVFAGGARSGDRISSCSGRSRVRLRARDDSRAFALRLRPNQDFAGALEAFCRERSIVSAQNPWRRWQHHRRALCGWAQSSSRSRPSLRSARDDCAGAGGALEAELDVALVDYTAVLPKDG